MNCENENYVQYSHCTIMKSSLISIKFVLLQNTYAIILQVYDIVLL